MSQSTKVSGAALAAAAALMFGSAAVTPARAEEAKVQCDGVNACKGQSACMTATSGCAGQNACKGQGWLEMTKAECDAAKARVKAAADDHGKR
jgi:hypothetical protein